MKLLQSTALAACVAVLAACSSQNSVAQASPEPDPRGAAVSLADALAGCSTEAAAPKEYTLEPSVRLIQVPCAQGAYQESFRFFVLRAGETKPELLAFVDFDGGRFVAATEAVSPEFDAASRTLTTFTKAAGHGGCGSKASYEWDGVRFALREIRARGCADLPPDPEPGDFPVVWPASGD